MNISLVMNTARSAVIEIADGGRYFTKKPYQLKVNGICYGETDRTITNIHNLKPETAYTVEVLDGAEVLGSVEFATEYEFVTLDVRKFGAKGDGESDDTHFIQAAIMGFDTSILIPNSQTPLIYPYFFVNLETQGIGGVAKWILILLVAFVAIGFLFFGLDKLGKKNSK